jgi:teichuronic acid biosynthesis glycosyltransferase TuaC
MRVLSSEKANPDVLMVTNMWPHDDHPGYGIFVFRQIESLRALGLDCEVIFVEGHRRRWAYVRESLRVLRLNFSSRRPRLVHAHGGETALVARWYVRGPVVVSYCGDDLLGTPRTDGSITLASRVRRTLLRAHAWLMTRTITKSAEMESVLHTSARGRNLVVPNGVDRSIFHPHSREEARRQLDWPAEDRIVLFAADPAVERKRYWLAEAACREAERTLGSIRLEVAWGTPPADMPMLMDGADCLLLTSAIEGSPNVVKEAVACDLPVVSTDVGDVAEILEDIDPSWVRASEPGALADALVECLTARRRSNGWERSAWLGQERIAERLLDLYAELVPGLAARRPQTPDVPSCDQRYNVRST